MTPSGDKPGRGSRRPSDKQGGPKRPRKQVEGYWKSLEVERDSKAEAERTARIVAADKARRERQAAEAARGGGRRHEVLGRQLRGRLTDTIAIAALIVLGLTTALVIVSQQKAALPGWVPLLGQDFFSLSAELETGQGVMPGQGQAVTVSGIRVGKIDSVELDDGHALVALDVEPKYAKLIHSDATLLLRPKTNLQDMVVEVEPGTDDELLEENSIVPLASTLPNINPDEVLATLDGDTRSYVRLLLQGVGEGLDGQGAELGSVFQRLYPFTRDIARLNTSVAKRRESLARVIHNFRLLAEELSANDEEVTRFVSGSAGALERFANQADSLQASLVELPGTLEQTHTALGASNRLSAELGPALRKLSPQADAFAPALRRFQTFFDETTPTIREQVTPFARQIRAPLHTLADASIPFKKTVTGFRDILKPLNYGFNELAYNPPGPAEGYLFHLPWLNHNLSSGYILDDAGGPIRRGTILLSCNTAGLANGFANGRPFLRTLLQLTRVPTPAEAC